MNIKNVGDFAKLAAICQKSGVSKLKISENGIEMELSEKPSSQKKQEKLITSGQTPVPVTQDFIPVEEYTEEQKLFWSSQGAPEDAFSGN